MDDPAPVPSASAALVIRADASSEIGSGHVMRCLALAQAWQDQGGAVTFVQAMDAGALVDRLRAEGMQVERLACEPGGQEDAAATASVAQRIGARWVVVDGYHFSSHYQRWLKDAGLKVLVLDDNCEQEHYYADYILNQNIHASEELYPKSVRERYTKLLLGLRYCLLRREFLLHRDFKREIPEKARNILVTMGGGDLDNITCRVLDAIKQIGDPDLSVRVLVGANNPHGDSIKRGAEALACKASVIVNAKDMPEQMMWADLAISAAGSTCWEFVCMKLPTVVIPIAVNQAQIAAAFTARHLGWFMELQALNSPENGLRTAWCRFTNVHELSMMRKSLEKQAVGMNVQELHLVLGRECQN